MGGLFWVALLLVAGFASPARAATAPVLVWDAPAGCPPATAVQGNVQRILEDALGAGAPVVATARALVVQGDPWQATVILELGGTRTERRFEAESCDAIAAAAALIIAIAIEDEQAAAAAPPATLPAAVDPPPFVALSPGERLPAGPGTEPAATTAESKFSRSRPLLTANGIVDWGTLPGGPAGGVEAAVGRRWLSDRVSLRALGTASYFPTHQLVSTPYAGFVYGDFWLAALSGRACAAAVLWRLEIGPCLGGELAVMHASSSDSIPNAVSSRTRPWFSALASMVASLRVSSNTLIAFRADLTVPTSHEVFGPPSSVVVIYRVPPDAFRGGLGIEHTF
jgi:hypothetical protein